MKVAEFCRAPGCCVEARSYGYCRVHEARGLLKEYNKLSEQFVVTAPRGGWVETPKRDLLSSWRPQRGWSTYIYAMGVRGAVKIGRANDVAQRLGDIQISNHRRVRLLAKIVAHTDMESDLHYLLADYRIRGEWFRLTGKVRDVVRAMRRNDLQGIVTAVDA